MMQSEFTELTKIHVTSAHYDEIEKRYMESGMDKYEFCKAYKANKDGMAEAAARDAGIKQALEINKKDWEVRNCKIKTERLERENEEMKTRLENAKLNYIKDTETLKTAYQRQADRTEKAEKKVEELEAEILKLKAKLYDMMTNNGAA